ncbi:MAG TPA: hypothetical protein VKB57_25760, partial [Acidimicrobiales bacterium]|nr:hypothetical protein [Acidimicrobiales bacterium]
MRPRAHLIPLQALVEAAEVELSTAGVESALLRVSSDPAAGGPELSWMDLDGAHPLELLLRLEAPPHWRAVGVSCQGWAHPLDARGRTRRGPGSPPVTVTLLVESTGETAGVLRQGDEVTPLPDRPEGVIADACRRVLGLPTAPPPPSTAELWTLYWLDRIVEEATRTDAQLRTWSSVAALHPATETAPTEHHAPHPDPDTTPSDTDATVRAPTTAHRLGRDATPERRPRPCRDPTPGETAAPAQAAADPTPPPHRDPTPAETHAPPPAA